jgi:uncharacterized protein YndB with AHSA1/START domain
MNMDQRSDSLTTVRGQTALRMERKLDHAPDKVWAALTKPSALARWFPAEVEMELRPGATITFRFPAGEAPVTTGVVTDVEPPTLFAFTWGDQHLSWSVAPYADGSLLTLVHTFGDHFGAASFASGWHLCINALGQFLDGGPVRPSRDTGRLHEAYVRRFDLGRGGVEAVPGGKRIRLERQLVRSAETVWEVLSDGVEPVAGLPVPEGFTSGKVAAGAVTEVRAPKSLTFAVDPHGSVTWEMGEGTGHGARLVLIQTGPEDLDAATALAAWQERVEWLAGQLVDS